MDISLYRGRYEDITMSEIPPPPRGADEMYNIDNAFGCKLKEMLILISNLGIL